MLKVFHDIENRGAKEMARRALQMCSQIFNYAIKLIMLTFVRTGELIGAKWGEFNFDDKQWIIPASRMKMRKEHIVPLSRQAIEILQDQKQYGLYVPEAYVFPSQIKHNHSMSNNTILKALERLGYKGKMTGHGFRSLAMTTIIEKLGYREKIPDLQLAQTQKNRVIASYNAYELLVERTKMMQEFIYMPLARNLHTLARNLHTILNQIFIFTFQGFFNNFFMNIFFDIFEL